MAVKYPNIEVELVGGDGNAMVIISKVTKALKRAKVDKTEIDAFVAEATSGDYNNVLATAMAWVEVH